MIADDHALVRSALKRLLKSHGVDVVGEVGDGPAAVEAAEALKPDVTMLDLSMPGMERFEALRSIVAGRRGHVLVLTGMEDVIDRAVEAIRLGARGFLLKSSTPDQLLRAVERVHAGEMFLDPTIADPVLKAAVQPSSLPVLTERELEVLPLVGRGLDNAAIGAALGIAPATARTHVGNIMQALKLRTRAQLVIYSIQAGMVSLSDIKANARKKPVERPTSGPAPREAQDPPAC